MHGLIIIIVIAFLVPSEPPTAVTATSSGPTSLHVSWGPIPADKLHGKLQYYLVRYNGTAGSGILNTTDTNVRITRLEEYMEYTVTISACSVKGEGNRSSPVAVTTAEAS